MYIHIYIHMYILTQTHTHTHTRIYIYVCMYIYIYVYICTEIYFMYIYKNVYISFSARRTTRRTQLQWPHRGPRTFHRKSTCTTQSTLESYVVKHWSRNTPQNRGE